MVSPETWQLVNSFECLLPKLKTFCTYNTCHIIHVICLFSIEQLIKLWKKTFWTIHQLSCFVGHPVSYKTLKSIFPKELSFCHKLYFSNLYIFATQCRRPFILQTKNSVRSNNLSLKYQGFTSSDCKDIGIFQNC